MVQGLRLLLGGDGGVERVIVSGLDAALVFGEFREGGCDIVAAVVVQAGLTSRCGKNDDGDFGITEDGKFHSLLE